LLLVIKIRERQRVLFLRLRSEQVFEARLNDDRLVLLEIDVAVRGPSSFRAKRGINGAAGRIVRFSRPVPRALLHRCLAALGINFSLAALGIN
jgi:hypothetical protein